MIVEGQERAWRVIESFAARFGEPHWLLACHAALPLALTPQIVHFLRTRFLRGRVPYVAEVDLLLSRLCRPAGAELFAMDSAVRARLLVEMELNPREHPELGRGRMREVARLILEWTRHIARSEAARHELRAQHWGAMLCLAEERDAAARAMAEAFRAAVDNPGEISSLSALVRAFAAELREYPELVHYAEEVGQLLAEPGRFAPTDAVIEPVRRILGIAVPDFVFISLEKSLEVVGKSGEELPRAVVNELGVESQGAKSQSSNRAECNLFLSYSNRDQGLRDVLETHFATLKREGAIRTWHDRRIGAGREWQGEIDQHLESANLILLLISPDFIGSDYCFDREMGRALERHRAGEARVVPVILRPTDWQTADFAHLQAIPRDGKAITKWRNRDEAFVEVVRGLRSVVAELRRVDTPEATPPRPVYSNNMTRELSESLEAAYRLKADLSVEGRDTTEVVEEILALRRRLRQGAQLKAGDYLLDGRFQLLEEIGHGGFAQVWKVYDRAGRAQVAVKVLHSQHTRDRSRRERFFRGARYMARLVHPNIVRVIEEQCEDGGYPFFVMEYLGGGDFRRAVLEGRLSHQERLQIVLEVGEALSFAHGNGVIHRDVNPRNILLAPDGSPKLTDFDLVRAADTTGGTRTAMLGTFLYTSPEAMADAREAAEPADVYGLGMTAIFALQGADLSADALWELPRLVSRLEVSERCRQVLLRAVARKVGERWSTVKDFCSALRQAGPLMRLSVSKVAPLIQGLAKQRILVFNNSGSRPLRIKIVPAGRPFRGITFEPWEFEIAPRKKAGVRAHLDEGTLPDNFVAQRISYQCQIDGDSRNILAFSIEVKAGPRPVVIPARVSFGKLEDGMTETRFVEVSNQGGIPLLLKEIEPEGSGQLRVGDGVSLPLKVGPGAMQAIELVWDTTRKEIASGADAVGFRLVFGNFQPDHLVGASAEVFGSELKIESSDTTDDGAV